MKKIFLLLLLSWLIQLPIQAQGWLKTYYSYTSNYLFSFSQKTIDNGYIIAGNMGSSNKDVELRKVDIFGNVQWTYRHVSPQSQWCNGVLQIPSDGSYVAFYYKGQFNGPTSNGGMIHVSATGQLIAQYNLPIASDITAGSHNSSFILTPQEDIVISSTKQDTGTNAYTLTLAKIDLSANLIWDRHYTAPASTHQFSREVIQTQDSNYVVVGYQRPMGGTTNNLGRNVIALKTDTAGNELWRQDYVNASHQKGYGVMPTQDGGCLILGRDAISGNDSKAMAMKVDALGSLQWDWIASTVSVEATLDHAVELSDGSFTCTGYSLWNSSTIAFIRLSATGQLLSNRSLSTTNPVARGLRIYGGNPNASTIPNGYSIFGSDGGGPFLMAVDSLGRLYTNEIVGLYYNDYNRNCVRDAGEPLIANEIIKATGDTRDFYGMSPSSGQYLIEVDTGNFLVSPRRLSPYWQVCADSQMIYFSGNYQRDTADFGLQAADSCVYLEVDISAPFLRRCFPSTYQVSYSNLGTQTALNAYVEVTLDPYQNYLSSSIPLIQQTGNVLRFDLGTVPTFSRGQFSLEVQVDCDSTVIGQVHCTEAHIYPDSICSSIAWTGAIIEAAVTNCTADSTTFRLRNLGAAMTSARTYTIIEEHIMLRQSPYQLGAGADQFITIPTRHGRVYRLEAEQESGFPPELGDPDAIAINIGCNNLPLLQTPNILNQFYNGNASSFVSVDCQANRGSFDPNDKQAQPVGYQANHYIESNTPLNYHIRFQNTGTDTAFTVVVVDTIDMNLDPVSIRMGASSHNYTWELRENGILVVTFDNIMLPDSGTNQVASNGFFKFSIQQDPNLPDGTQIFNDAAIYFDFNKPIITNEVFHTIGSGFVNSVVINVDKIDKQQPEVRVYPNPFAEQATFEVENGQYETLQLEVYSPTGQLLQQHQSSANNRLVLHRNNLPAGMYFYRLLGDGQVLSTGKVMLK